MSLEPPDLIAALRVPYDGDVAPPTPWSALSFDHLRRIAASPRADRALPRTTLRASGDHGYPAVYTAQPLSDPCPTLCALVPEAAARRDGVAPRPAGGLAPRGAHVVATMEAGGPRSLGLIAHPARSLWLPRRCTRAPPGLERATSVVTTGALHPRPRPELFDWPNPRDPRRIGQLGRRRSERRALERRPLDTVARLCSRGRPWAGGGGCAGLRREPSCARVRSPPPRRPPRLARLREACSAVEHRFEPALEKMPGSCPNRRLRRCGSQAALLDCWAVRRGPRRPTTRR